METSLHPHIPDQSIAAPGFLTVRADRDATESGKKRGRGMAIYVSERWCIPGHVCVKERLCSSNVKLLAVGLRPYYLPREFTSAIVITVYIPPSADREAAADVINTRVSCLQTQQHPFVINGDFNHVTLNGSLPGCTQYVDCHTRENNTLDFLYANAPDAYEPLHFPPW